MRNKISVLVLMITLLSAGCSMLWYSSWFKTYIINHNIQKKILHKTFVIVTSKKSILSSSYKTVELNLSKLKMLSIFTYQLNYLLFQQLDEVMRPYEQLDSCC